MKKFLRDLFLCMLVFYLTTNIFTGIVMPIISIYAILTLLVLSIGINMSKPFLSFLTIKGNFLTYFLMSSLITIGITFLLKIFMTGFIVETSQFTGLSLDFLEIKGFEINGILTIVLFSVLSSFISTIFYLLNKSD